MIDPVLMTFSYLSVFMLLQYYNDKLVDLYSDNKYYKFFVDTLYYIFNFVMLCLSINFFLGFIEHKFYLDYFEYDFLFYFFNLRMLAPLKIVINQLSGKKSQLKDLVINLSTIWLLILFINYNLPWSYGFSMQMLYLLC